MSILGTILKHKREEIGDSVRSTPIDELKARIVDMDATKSFRDALVRKENSPINLIAEVKKASPSKGLIRDNFNLSEIISVYHNKPVAAISVLTDEKFFGGKLKYLREARKKTDKPLLRKDFIIDPYQVYEARTNSADAILLIAAALDKSQLADLFGLAHELSLDCLVEVHNYKELDAALYCGSEIIGINNRDLNTLDISLNVSLGLFKDVPSDRIIVSESGIASRKDVETMQEAGLDAILVGSTIMKEKDMSAKIDELMGLTTDINIINS
ncbi:MAG: indole-3-glycerol phosphate synthase TrpC [Nitrospira sp.]|nr:indole-3-glycerol phosphate synthase TrpC [bacterium]MBL7048936.1 indole-3-glycerol phosphate synthase TrpC [Nitrospira sp.]